MSTSALKHLALFLALATSASAELPLAESETKLKSFGDVWAEIRSDWRMETGYHRECRRRAVLIFFADHLHRLARRGAQCSQDRTCIEALNAVEQASESPCSIPITTPPLEAREAPDKPIWTSSEVQHHIESLNLVADQMRSDLAKAEAYSLDLAAFEAGKLRYLETARPILPQLRVVLAEPYPGLVKDAPDAFRWEMRPPDEDDKALFREITALLGVNADEVPLPVKADLGRSGWMGTARPGRSLDVDEGSQELGESPIEETMARRWVRKWRELRTPPRGVVTSIAAALAVLGSQITREVQRMNATVPLCDPWER